MKITTEESIRKARVELEKKLRKQTEKLSSLKEQLIHEVNERKLIDQSLKKSNSRLKQVERMAHLGSWEWDIIQNKTNWSDELYHIFGVKREQFNPDAYEIFLNCIYTDDRQLVQKTIEKAINEKEPFSIEYRIVKPDETVRDIHARGEVICDEAENPVKMIGTSQDVTERKQVEERFLGVLESAPDAMIITDEDGKIQFINKQTEKLFGYEKEELLGEKVEKLMPQRFRTTHSNHQKNYKSNPKTRAMGEGLELLGLRKDGEEFPIDISLGPVKTHEGLMVTAAIRDITKRKHEEDLLKKAESETRRLRSDLEHVNRVDTLDTLASAIAHEINQPLAAILSNAQAALRLLNINPPDLNEVREALTDIVYADKRAGEVIRRIRTLVKKEELHHKPYNINTVINEVIDLVQSEVVIQNASIRTNLEPQVPILSGDNIQMQQVILNLIMNALDAVKNQPIDARHIVIATSIEDKKSVEVRVTDSGPGVDEDSIENIFNAFYTTKIQGMGLGLSVCYSIIENHGGRLWAENCSGGGAKFSFQLPLRKDDD